MNVYVELDWVDCFSLGGGERGESCWRDEDCSARKRKVEDEAA